MTPRADRERPAYIARYGWRTRAVPAVWLAAAALGTVVAFALDPPDTLGASIGTLALATLFAAGAVAYGGPALSHRVAVRVDTAGITIGGLGPVDLGERLVPWAQVAGVRCYELVAAVEDKKAYNSVVQVDLRDAGAVRTFTDGAQVAYADLAAAVGRFAPTAPNGPPVVHLGYVDARDDPMRGASASWDPHRQARELIRRLRARRGS